MSKKWYDTEAGKKILSTKYYHKGETEPEQFIERVSNIFSDELKPKFKDYFTNGDLSPAGRVLYGAGAKGKFKATTSNCYILPSPEDNIESIFKVNSEIARVFSYGGGIGVNISKLRPKDAAVHNAARTSTGAVSFLKIFDSTGEVISQNGRRGAIMVGLNCDHPDIYDFLNIKNNNEKLASMNISILFTDEFMKAVETDSDFELKFKVEATGQEIKKVIKAKDFFMDYCKTQWDWGDPGALFIDRFRKYNLLSGYKEYHLDITNPCGEFAGNEYNSCNLLSLNVYNFIEDKFNNPYLNEDKLKDAIDVGIQSLDEILDYGYDTQPLEKNRKCIDDWRSIGLGVFGLADALVAMKLTYGSKEGNAFVEKLMRTIFYESLRFDALLAKKKGAFEKYNWDFTSKSALIQMTKKEEPDIYNLIKDNGLRNGTLVSIAPTGTISLLMGNFSGGCEPLYKISYERTTHKLEQEGKSFTVFAHSVEDLLAYHNIDATKITTNEIQKRFPWVIASHDVPFLKRVDLQSIMQRYVDNSISSTVNLRSNATPEDIFDIYFEAWKSKCKGITVFRDGCKRGNILGTDKKTEKEKIVYNSIHPNKREKVRQVKGYTLVRKTSCVDKMYITINKTSTGEIFEIFTNVSGGCQSNITTITRLASLALRCGVKVEDVIKQLTTAKCSACQALIRNGKKDISLSCGNAIGSALTEVYNMHKENENKYVDDDDNPAIKSECPVCHQHTLKPEGKCVNCTNCGWSRCE